MASAPVQRQWDGSDPPARKPSPDSPPKSVTSSKFNIGPPGSLGSGKRLVVPVPPWAKHEQPVPDEDISLSPITSYANGNSNGNMRSTSSHERMSSDSSSFTSSAPKQQPHSGNWWPFTVPTMIKPVISESQRKGRRLSKPRPGLKQSGRNRSSWIFGYALNTVGSSKGKKKRPEDDEDEEDDEDDGEQSAGPSSVPERQKQRLRQGLSRRVSSNILRLDLPLPPAPFTKAQIERPGWETPWNPRKWLTEPEETHHPDRRASTDVTNGDLSRLPPATDRWTKFITVVPGQHGRFKVKADSKPIYGGFSDVWQCDAKLYNGKFISVAVKKFRAVRIPHDADANTTTNKLLKRLTKELDIWMTLKHPNITPLIGFVLTGDMCLISPWYPKGNVGDYIIRHPEVDRIKLVLDVACGLAYLHNLTFPVVHGDIKPDNVLINENGDAHIIDFGLSSVLEAETPLGTSFTTASLQDSGNARWMAPELLMEEGCTRSPSTDVYSFGSVALYIYTGEPPFKRIPNIQIIRALIRGKTPLGERDDYPALWAPGVEWFQDLLVVCWDLKPELRPSMTNLEERIKSCGVKGDAEPLRTSRVLEVFDRVRKGFRVRMSFSSQSASSERIPTRLE